MVEINRFVHCYDFNYSYFLNNYIDELLDIYDKFPSKPNDREGFDFPLKINDINGFLIPKLNKLIEDNYYVGKRYKIGGINVYIQEPNQDKDNYSTIHNHAHHPGNMCGVFYLNIPQEGGEFHVSNPPLFDQYIKPQLDKVYLFPVWLMHRGIPHKDNIKRICFNFWYAGNIRPIHKLNGNLW